MENPDTIYSGQQYTCTLAASRDGGCGLRWVTPLLPARWRGGFESPRWAEIRSTAGGETGLCITAMDPHASMGL